MKPIYSKLAVLLIFLFLLGFGLDLDGQRKRPRRKRGPDTAPKSGQVAPTFDLKLLYDKGGKSVNLEAFKGKRPVILIFGSYT
jgi:cytochrome oxidase Cu insertion factor (SCO1/SenC/PrrC family)